jgi:hypothetical protein
VCNATQNVPLMNMPRWKHAKRDMVLFLDLKVCHSEQSQHCESFYDSLLSTNIEGAIKVVLKNG